jgi:branched-chain amino acid transport system permease protein
MPSIIPQLVATGLMLGAVYALIALGFHIINEATGIINFAQGEFVVLGGFLMWWYYVGLALPLLLAFPLTAVTVAVLVAGFERLAIRPVQQAPPLIPILVTLAGGILIRTLMLIVWGPRPRAVPHFSGEHPVHILGAAVLPQAFWIVGVTIVVLAGVYLFFHRTILGLSMLATASNLEGARVIGVNVGRITLYAFAFSGLLSGIAGALIVPITNANFALGLDFALKGFAGAILGGLNRAEGVVAGGIVVGLAESLMAGLVSSQYRNLLVFAIIIAVLVLRPEGLIGKSGAR